MKWFRAIGRWWRRITNTKPVFPTVGSALASRHFEKIYADDLVYVSKELMKWWNEALMTSPAQVKQLEEIKINSMRLKEGQTVWKCINCKHQYSPHLAKRCPKCGCEGLEEHKEVMVEMPATVERFHITTDKDGVKQ